VYPLVWLQKTKNDGIDKFGRQALKTNLPKRGKKKKKKEGLTFSYAKAPKRFYFFFITHKKIDLCIYFCQAKCKNKTKTITSTI